MRLGAESLIAPPNFPSSLGGRRLQDLAHGSIEKTNFPFSWRECLSRANIREWQIESYLLGYFVFSCLPLVLQTADKASIALFYGSRPHRCFPPLSSAWRKRPKVADGDPMVARGAGELIAVCDFRSEARAFRGDQ